jgi:cell division protein FtsL
MYYLLLLLLLSVVIGFLAYSNWRINKRRTELISKIQYLQQEIQVTEKKNQELKSGISQGSSQSYLEEIARTNLGLKKPGEEVVVVLPPPEKETETKKEEQGIWQRILEKIKSW